jgi:hypothetical protein
MFSSVPGSVLGSKQKGKGGERKRKKRGGNMKHERKGIVNAKAEGMGRERKEGKHTVDRLSLNLPLVPSAHKQRTE